MELFLTISGGVPVGNASPIQDETSKPGIVSAMVGTFGANGKRFELPTPSAMSLPDLICGHMVATTSNIISTWSPSSAGSAAALPANGTCRISVLVSCLNHSADGRWGGYVQRVIAAELAKTCRVITWDRRNTDGQADIVIAGEQSEAEIWADDLALHSSRR